MTLNACGFSSDDNNLNEGTVDLPNDATEAPSNAQNIDVSQVKTLKKSTSERVGALSAGISDIIETGTLNSTGEFTHPQAAQEFTGNITAAFEVADEQGIARVFLAFAQSDLELPICKESCGNNFSSVVSGINPAVFGLSSGEQILQVWVEDNQGNLDRVDTVNVNWQSKAISGVNASYDEDTETVNVSWNALEGILRYNVYLATDAALKGQNVLELEGGDTRLALTSTSASFENKAADNYFIVITGVDGTGESAFSEQIVLINNLNQVPTADNLSFTTLEDQPLTGNLLTAQQNDYETLILNIEAVSAPSLGSLVLSETGAFTYTPNANVTGTDQFSYELSNEAGLSAQGIVEITITAVNDAPVALADNYTLNADASSLTITAPGLLANDSDIDGDNLSVVAEPVIAPTLGELSLSSDGSFVYTPSERFVNFDTFTYQISDAAGETSDAIVTITTDDFNGQIPIAKNGEYSVNEDSFLEIASDEGLFTLVSDGDNDLDDLTLSIVTEPQNGALLL
ncbi:MAG: tandem-95 repeat protein, partial [Gammaproteobacteria bacterium]|nr:tandem-95 repeat protein [Gammaproteobacteria bacterium]